MPDQTHLKCVLKDVTSNLINVGCRNTIATALINSPSWWVSLKPHEQCWGFT